MISYNLSLYLRENNLESSSFLIQIIMLLHKDCKIVLLEMAFHNFHSNNLDWVGTHKLKFLSTWMNHSSLNSFLVLNFLKTFLSSFDWNLLNWNWFRNCQSLKKAQSCTLDWNWYLTVEDFLRFWWFYWGYQSKVITK